MTMHPDPPLPARSPITPGTEGYFALAPTARTRAMRTFIPWQLWRFMVINVRMLRMIAKSHD
jgi:hypothetical protein